MRHDAYKHILVLWTLAVAQPVYQFLAKNSPFLVAYNVHCAEIFILIFVLSLQLPLALMVIPLVARRLGSVMLQKSINSIVFVLSAVLFTMAARSMEDFLPGMVICAIGLFCAAMFTQIYEDVALLPRLLSWLLPIVAIPPIIFLSHATIMPLAFGGAVGKTPKRATILNSANPDRANVFVMVFDELPVSSLMNEKFEIDRAHFPAFGRLADDAVWYRNASAVAVLTSDAIPAILTGRYARPHSGDTVPDHSQNLFSWLSGVYRLQSSEQITRLCPADDCTPPGVAAGISARSRNMCRILYDLTYLSPYLVFPDDITHGLPHGSSVWMGFAQNASFCGAVPYVKGSTHDEREAHFSDYVASIQHTSSPQLFFLHTLLPHGPWTVDPKEFYPRVGYKPFNFKPELRVQHENFQNHLIQTQLADYLLGTLIDRLKSSGIYDNTLLIVLADHGVNFWSGEGGRSVLIDGHPQDVMRIPFFIKLPISSKNKSIDRVDDRNIEEIDVVPTIAEVLNMPLPWAVDGRSVFEKRLPNAQKKVMNNKGEILTLPSNVRGIEDTLQFKQKMMQYPG